MDRFARRRIGPLATAPMRAALYYAHKRLKERAEDTNDGPTFDFSDPDHGNYIALIEYVDF